MKNDIVMSAVTVVIALLIAVGKMCGIQIPLSYLTIGGSAFLIILLAVSMSYWNRQQEQAKKDLMRATAKGWEEGRKTGLECGRHEPNGLPVEHLPLDSESYILRTMYSNKTEYYFVFEGIKTGLFSFHKMRRSFDFWFAPDTQPKVHGVYAFARVTCNYMVEATGGEKTDVKKWSNTLCLLKNVGDGKVDEPVGELWYKNEIRVTAEEFNSTSAVPAVAS